MKVVLKINLMEWGKVVENVGKSFANFPPEGLPSVGDVWAIEKEKDPDANWRDPIVRKRTRIFHPGNPEVEVEWLIECQTDSRDLLVYLCTHYQWIRFEGNGYPE